MSHNIVHPKGWIKAEKIRIPPLSDQHNQWYVQPLNYMINRQGKLQASNLFMTLMGNFRIFSRWILFASSLMPYGQLKRRETELIILRVAWNCRCLYEWKQHEVISQKVGVTSRDLLAVTLGSEGFSVDSCEALLMLACDEFHHHRMIGEQTWHKLTQFYHHKNLLEILMVIGHYEMLAGILNSTGIEVDKNLSTTL